MGRGAGPKETQDTQGWGRGRCPGVTGAPGGEQGGKDPQDTGSPIAGSRGMCPGFPAAPRKGGGIESVVPKRS